MTVSINDVSRPARIAEQGEAISIEELALAARNHAMPLEALRYDVTPPGLHYVLVHYDIPCSTPTRGARGSAAVSRARPGSTWTRCRTCRATPSWSPTR